MEDKEHLTSCSENFAISLSDNCKTHGEWLSVVRFGLRTLLENELLLFEIISREAVRMQERHEIKSRVLADELRQIFNELGLRLSVTTG